MNFMWLTDEFRSFMLFKKIKLCAVLGIYSTVQLKEVDVTITTTLGIFLYTIHDSSVV